MVADVPDAFTLPADAFGIVASSARTDDRTRVLKHGDTFAVFDRFGEIDSIAPTELGLYHRDTRFLSRLALRIEGQRPLLLDSTVRSDNSLFTIDLTNPAVRTDGGAIPHGALHVFRAKLIWQSTCHERLRIHNYGQVTVEITLSIEFGADFVDLFEVRGTPRQRRGALRAPFVEAGTLVLSYQGLDGQIRRTRIVPDPLPEWQGVRAVYRVRLAPNGVANFRWAIECAVGPPAAACTPPSFDAAADSVMAEMRRVRERDPELHSSNEQFNDWLNRSLADVHMLRTETPYGPYPYAGVPWFSTVFGRDGIISALQYLWLNPTLARGVLACLAATQATGDVPDQDAQPGKILHEMRAGEMAALGEVPFGRYYGSIDATPLFVMLAGAYYERTGDVEFVRVLWPNIERALAWIDRYGDPDGDGFFEYARRSRTGLLHQGWKDSENSVFHADGRPADGPIALCEVQGYVYAARLAAARLAGLLNLAPRAQALAKAAADLREHFEAAFWCEELSTYALALDGHKQPCRVVASNAGHCLFTGIASDAHARRVADTLTGPESYSGWGIRTVALRERAYNPMSYHNGSIWPHDNALIAAGLARYRLKEAAAKILTGLFDATLFFDQHRLPELFCGFLRRPDQGPTLYPVACAPQAWAAGAVFMCLQACLGLEVRTPEATVTFTNPLLPSFLNSVYIRRLAVGEATIDLALTRHTNNVGINVLGRNGAVNVLSVK